LLSVRADHYEILTFGSKCLVLKVLANIKSTNKQICWDGVETIPHMPLHIVSNK